MSPRERVERARRVPAAAGRVVARALGVGVLALVLGGCAVLAHPDATLPPRLDGSSSTCTPDSATIVVDSAGSGGAAAATGAASPPGADDGATPIAAAWSLASSSADHGTTTSSHSTQPALEPADGLERAFGSGTSQHEWIAAIIEAALAQHRVPTGWGTPVSLADMDQLFSAAGTGGSGRTLYLVEATALRAPATVRCGDVAVAVAVTAPNPASFLPLFVTCGDRVQGDADALVRDLCGGGS